MVNIAPAHFDTFRTEAENILGAENVAAAEETLTRYGEHTLPGPNRPPMLVIYPGSTAEVQAIVRLANETRVPLFPISAGYNVGLGSRSPPRAGQIVVDLGKRMNRILEVNEILGFVVVEPGVSFQAIADELQRRGGRWMISVTSGPPQGSVVGNVADRGSGYGPHFDHFASTCGLEIVLGNGELLRTGDGVLEHDSRPNWHVSKYSFGPILDGLFTQSNFGIITRLGIWLLPKPPVIQSFHFNFPNDADLAEIVELARPLKLSNFVPTIFRISGDLYMIGTEEVSPNYGPGGRKGRVDDTTRRALQRKHGVGAWTLSGALYGASAESLTPQIERVRKVFEASGKATYISHQDALSSPIFQTIIHGYEGVPTSQELGLLKWRPGGGAIWFLPGTPMIGEIANALHIKAREIAAGHDFDYITMNVSSARFMRNLHLISYNREDASERTSADQCYRQLALLFQGYGINIGRSPIDYYDFHLSSLMPSFAKTCSALKNALDPNHVLAPGRYGID